MYPIRVLHNTIFLRYCQMSIPVLIIYSLYKGERVGAQHQRSHLVCIQHKMSLIHIFIPVLPIYLANHLPPVRNTGNHKGIKYKYNRKGISVFYDPFVISTSIFQTIFFFLIYL